MFLLSLDFQDFIFLNQLALSTIMQQSSGSKNSTNTSNTSKNNINERSFNNNDVEESLIKSDAGSDDPFDQDDSFLVQCSQAIEEKVKSSNPPVGIGSNFNHHFKVPQLAREAQTDAASSKVTATETNDDDTSIFDDDEFETLLSQIEIPEAISTGTSHDKSAPLCQSFAPSTTSTSLSSSASSGRQPSGPSANWCSSTPVQLLKPILVQPLNDSSRANPNMVGLK